MKGQEPTGETVGKGVGCDNIPSGQDGIDQDQRFTSREARMGWGKAVPQRGSRPHPHAVACVQV